MSAINMLLKIGEIGKKVLLCLIISGMVVSSLAFTKPSYADMSINSNRKVDIVVRTGEYSYKPGKRAYVTNIKNIPTDIPLRKDENGFYIHEYDINVKLATKIAQKLADKGLDVDLQKTNGKSEDLNSAGRLAKAKEPSIYLSIHHNSFKEDSSGYFFMVNEKDTKSSLLAKDLSDSIKNNPSNIPQMENRVNHNSYIGEMNKCPGEINILGEFGFFSNVENELPKIMSDEYTDYVSEKMADELYDYYQENFSSKESFNLTTNFLEWLMNYEMATTK